jgi:hypothetical protein
MDVKLPFPSDLTRRKEISHYIKEIIDDKTEIRKKILKLSINTFDD